MPDPVSLAVLGVAIGKLLLRWGDLNDTADALEDTRAGFSALRTLKRGEAQDRVGTAISEILEQRLAGVRDPGRREDMQIVVENVAAVFTNLTDDDIRAAAQHPDGFAGYLTRGSGQALLSDTREALARGPGRTLLTHTEQALTPFTAQLITAAAVVFAELAPRSGRFTAGALVRLLNQVDAALSGVTDLQEQITSARDVLLAAHERVAQRLEAVHFTVDQIPPKLDEILLRSTRSSESAVDASREATRQGKVVGPPITECDPGLLGVHPSITVHDEESLTPYLARGHDQRLRQVLEQAAAADRPTLVLVVGTSCAGKTRSLYEAVRTVLPDWAVTAPRTAGNLAQTLTAGIPARTVVWLDELQNHLIERSPGIAAAEAITDLLLADDVGPIVVAGTLWPTNLERLRDRPDPDKAAAGAGAITTLIARATTITVPDTFTDTDLEDTDDVDDPRLQLAIRTATHIDHPEHGRKITQVLAGGTQLIHRLYPRGAAPVDEFSPAAKALLHAAGDLRRVGMPNPLPRWALDGSAPGYLDPPDPTPPDQWLPDAFDETTDTDKPRTRTYKRDHYALGVPALTPHWTTTDDGETVEAYDLHDYLTQDHLTRHRHTPTQPALWGALATHTHPPDIALNLAKSAEHRGLLTAAITLLRPLADAGYKLRGVVARRGTGAQYAQELGAQDEVIRLLARRGTDTDITELRTLANTGNRHAQKLLARLFVERGTKPRARANTGNGPAQDALARLLANRGTDKTITLLRYFVREGLCAPQLLDLYRAQSPYRHVLELDCNANPVTDKTIGPQG